MEGMIVDWGAIKAEYLAGGTSYRKLAVKHGVPRRTIENRAKAEQWTDLRCQVSGKVVAELPEAIAKTVLLNAQAWVEEVMKLATQMMGELEDRLDGTQKVVVNSNGGRVVLELPWLNKAQDLKAAVSALAALDEVGRRALGLDNAEAESEADQNWDDALRLIEERAEDEGPE